MLLQVKERLRDFALHNSSTITLVGRPPTCWQPPNRAQYNVNFDGALFNSENCVGLGVVIRNDMGQVMVSLSQKTTLPFTAIEVEAIAARRALKLALETGFDRVILEGDSQILITALETSPSLFVPLRPYSKRHSTLPRVFLEIWPFVNVIYIFFKIYMGEKVYKNYFTKQSHIISST